MTTLKVMANLCQLRSERKRLNLTVKLELIMQIEGPLQVARRSDVDMNGHINNVTYIAWTLETVPREVFYNYELQQVCHMLAALLNSTANSIFL